MQKDMNFNDVAIVSVKGSDCRMYMSKNDVINMMKNSNLNEKSGPLHIKISETTYYQRNRDIIINRTKDY